MNKMNRFNFHIPRQGIISRLIIVLILATIFIFPGCGGGGGGGSSTSGAAPSPTPTTPTTDQYSLSGYAMDGDAPIYDATVTLEIPDKSILQTKTGVDGYYIFPDVTGPCTANLTITHFIYDQFNTTINIGQAETTASFELSSNKITYPQPSRQLFPEIYPQPAHTLFPFSITNSNTGQFNIHATGEKQPHTYMISIENTGDTIISNPLLTVNGKGDFTSNDTILEEITEPGMTDFEKVFAIWWFIVNNRFSDTPTLAHPGNECSSLVRIVNVYGNCICDDIMSMTANLCDRSGLHYRGWHLSGHMIPEILLDGQWRVIDASHEILYVKDDGSPASYDELTGPLEAILNNTVYPKYPDNAYTTQIHDIYMSLDNNSQYVINNFDNYHINYTIRPNEKFEMFRANEGIYYAKNWPGHESQEPFIYSCGWIQYKPDLANPATAAFFDDVQNVEFTTGGARLTKTGQGRFIIKTYSPYVLIGAYMKAEIFRNNNAKIRISFSLDGKQTWTPLWESAANQTVQNADVDFSRFFVTLENDPYREYYVKIELFAEESVNDAIVRNLTKATQVQMAPQGQPHLFRGANIIRYKDESITPSNVEVRYIYTVDSDDVAYNVVSTTPADGEANVDTGTLIQAEFNEDVTSANNDFHSTVVYVTSPTKVIKGAISYDSPTKTMTFAPDSPLDPDTEYRVFINRRCLLKDDVNRRAAKLIGRKYMDYKWSFTTAP